MNDAFAAYVASARALASERNIPWEQPVECDGSIDKQAAWDLTAMAGTVPPPFTRLSDLGSDRNTVEVLNQHLAEIGRPAVAKTALSQGWQDLIKAATIHQILVLRNTPGHVSLQVIRPLRALGTCVQALSGAEPWAMTADDVRFARAVAIAVQASGKLGELVESVVKYIFDARYLCDHGPFHQLLKTERGGAHTASQTWPSDQERAWRAQERGTPARIAGAVGTGPHRFHRASPHLLRRPPVCPNQAVDSLRSPGR